MARAKYFSKFQSNNRKPERILSGFFTKKNTTGTLFHKFTLKSLIDHILCDLMAAFEDYLFSRTSYIFWKEFYTMMSYFYLVFHVIFFTFFLMGRLVKFKL